MPALQSCAVCWPAWCVLTHRIAFEPVPSVRHAVLTHQCALQIGIVPTDSFPALVCDLENAASVNMLAAVKEVSPSKPMSILLKGYTDVDKYTLGWPPAKEPGQPDTFSIVKRLLPGAFTFILPASKNMPKIQPQGSSKAQRKKKQRLTVGVRMPDNAVCQALLDMLDTCASCTVPFSTILSC